MYPVRNGSGKSRADRGFSAMDIYSVGGKDSTLAHVYIQSTDRDEVCRYIYVLVILDLVLVTLFMLLGLGRDGRFIPISRDSHINGTNQNQPRPRPTHRG